MGKRVMSWHLEMTPQYRACFLNTRACIMKGLQEESPGCYGPDWGLDMGRRAGPAPRHRAGNADLGPIGFHRFPPVCP